MTKLIFQRQVTVFFILLLVVCSYQSKAQQRQQHSGVGDFIYSAYKPLSEQPVKVWYFIPDSIKSDSPILFVMHGNSRNAKGYRDAMIASAQQYQFVLVVPEFSKEYYPKVRDYHHGGIMDDNKQVKPKELWTFSIIEPLFDEIKRRFENSNENYLMCGFSAGSQFVHRFMYLVPENRAAKAITASAGTYTMPDFKTNYSYGLANLNIPKENIRKFYARDFIVAVGDADTVLSRSDLVKTKAANKQGRDRVERAHNFFQKSKDLARQENTPFNWKIVEVPHLGHSQGDMARPIADLMFGSK